MLSIQAVRGLPRLSRTATTMNSGDIYRPRLRTDIVRSVVSVRPSVCLFSFYLLNLLTFGGGHVPECVGHDHSLLWVAKQSQGLRLGLGLAEMITRSV